MGHGIVTVKVRTTPRTSVTLTLALTHTTVTYKGKGKHRKRITHTATYYRVTAHARTGRKGLATDKIRIAYAPRHSVRAKLTVTAHTARVTTTTHSSVTIVPAPPSHPKARHAKARQPKPPVHKH